MAYNLAMPYQRYTTFPAETVFAAMSAKQKRMVVGEGTGISCGMVSLRMRVFHTHGPVCAKCGEKGTHFAVERPLMSDDPRTWHFNLYSDNDVMLTFDHVMPKSKGGANTIENAQTLCYPCNQEKADEFDGVSGVAAA